METNRHYAHIYATPIPTSTLHLRYENTATKTLQKQKQTTTTLALHKEWTRLCHILDIPTISPAFRRPQALMNLDYSRQHCHSVQVTSENRRLTLDNYRCPS